MTETVVLCVDDDATLLQALRSLLVPQLGLGHWVEIAESAEEALEICREMRDQQRHLAVVISDYIMPGMRGDELLVRLHGMAPATVKMMLTGQSDLSGVKRALAEADLYRCLEKPFVSEELVRSTRAAVRTYWERQAWLSRRSATGDPRDGLCTAPELAQLLDERLSQPAARPLCVTLIDLGEEEGSNERPLLALVQQLQRHQRATDVVGRWGGEAFLVINCNTELPDAFAHAEALRQRMALQGLQGAAQLSLGVASSRPGEPALALIERAAQALQAARIEGCVQVGVAD
ncbi:response regulator [Inhella sp.]|uniref:response regulator n=1 Tax=Inhella sp. TaxID=1921806 RepID=UPI0035AE01AF